MKRLRFLEEAQWWDVGRLYEYRDCSLRSLINIAYREVPFYRKLMNNAGVKPNDLHCRDDLSKSPIGTKEMLRAGYPHLTTRETGQKTYEVSTSDPLEQIFA